MIVAKWRHGTPAPNADAQKVAEEVSRLGDSITPSAVLEIARAEETELHKCFEWDDAKASEKYRLIQARNVIRFLVIKEEKVPTERPEIRLFYKTEKKEGYKPVQIIVKNEDEHKKLLEEAWSWLHWFKRKYSTLEELSEIFELIS